MALYANKAVSFQFITWQISTEGSTTVWEHYYRLPTKLQEVTVFSRVYLSFCSRGRGGGPYDYHPWCIRPHHTRTSPPPLPLFITPPSTPPSTPSPGHGPPSTVTPSPALNTYSNLFNLDLTVQITPFSKHVHTCLVSSTYDWQVVSWYPTGMLSCDITFCVSLSRLKTKLQKSISLRSHIHIEDEMYEYQLTGRYTMGWAKYLISLKSALLHSDDGASRLSQEY